MPRNNQSLPCPYCGHEVSNVTHVEHLDNEDPHVFQTRRRRVCKKCRLSFYTREVPEDAVCGGQHGPNPDPSGK